MRNPFGSFHVLLWLVIVGLLFVSCDSFPSDEVLALAAFKEEIYEDPFLLFSNWNILDGDPCNWSGISCSSNRQHITKLDISGANLRGFLVPELGKLTYLKELVLYRNNLIGIIPKELGMLKKLTVLDLGANKLSGRIPSEIVNLANIVKINLQSNMLSGTLPPKLGNLKYLEELRLDRNKLQGTVPGCENPYLTNNTHSIHRWSMNLTGFCRPTRLKVADFSYNFFVGSIPKCLRYLPRSSFQRNCLKTDDPKQRSMAQCSFLRAPPAKIHSEGGHIIKNRSDESKHGLNLKPAWVLGLEIVTGTMIGSIFLVAVFTTIQKCNKKSSVIVPWKKFGSRKDQDTIYIDYEILKDVRRYSRQELELACEEFSNIIGSSPDSLVYKGNIKGGPEIAVISLCVKEEHWAHHLELYFQGEVADLVRLDHENLGKLLGYCSENEPFTRMLVSEYAPNGTLFEHLHYGEEGCQLSWTRRMRIIIGIARGLAYLHTELQPPFTISELNSGSIYLTDDFTPKLVEFDNWKTILSRSAKNSGCIGGHVGANRILPNSLESRDVDIRGNIYAFGVICLEIISGRPPYCKDKGCLVDWAEEYLKMPEVISNVVDPELKHFGYEDLKVICEVVSLCLCEDSAEIPSMRELRDVLERKIDTSVSVEITGSSLAWAQQLVLSS